MHRYSLVIQSGEKIDPKIMVDNVLVYNPTLKTIDKLLNIMARRQFNHVTMITLATKSRKKVIDHLKSSFTIIEAGGGIVKKKHKYLMIHRKGQWDIPKGKMERGEKPKTCAGREVEEETGVKVKVREKIGIIWHTYMLKDRNILKKTHWYVMTCLDDTNMKPQVEEDISKVRWMSMQEMQEVLVDSYRSLRFLVQKYRQDS